MHADTQRKEQGMALLTVLVLIAMLMVLIAGFAGVTSIETATTRSSMRSFQGFYAAEAGLNTRADQFRQLFVGESLPTGTGPTLTGTPLPCFGGNQGAGNFACSTFEFQKREVKTYVEESALSSNAIVVPRGELFQNQFGKEYHYVVYSQALNANGASEAALEMHFKSRTLPLFQWAAFYDKDLELLPNPGLVFNGPVHTNADMYLGTAGTTLNITGQVSAVKAMYIGRKDANTCLTGTVKANNPDVLTALPGCTSGRRSLTPAEVAPWGGMVGVGVDPVSVPGPEILDRATGAPYWTRADLRVVLNMNVGTPEIEVRDPDGSVNVGRTVLLGTCGAATATTNTLYDNREAGLTRTLDVDVQGLLSCPKLPQLVTTALVGGGSAALVFYFGVDGPGSTAINHYGVRLKNAAELTTILPGNTTLTGMTVASDQAIYIKGNYNSINKKPAAILGDVINVLSNNWTDAGSTLVLASRVPTATTINAALYAGTDTTGGSEGAAGQNGGGYNGGVESFIRLHENWNSTVTLTYRGSLVSLFRPRRVAGAWVLGSPQYTAPIRDWDYENTFFEDPTKLPPMTPNLVYLRQELFVRKFDS